MIAANSLSSFKKFISMSICAVMCLLPAIVAAAPEYADAPIASSSAGPEWVSSDGRYVGVASATSLISDGLGGGHFIRDRVNMQTIRINNVTSNDFSIFSATEDMNTLFISTSQALVPQDTNNTFDIYALDRSSGVYELISVSSDGILGNGLSRTGGTARTVSTDGRYVVFLSEATNLAPGSDTNSFTDSFVRDRQSHITKRLSSDSSGNAMQAEEYNVTISGDGTKAAFASEVTNQVPGGLSTVSRQILVQDLTTGTNTRASAPQGVAESNNGVVTCRVPSLSITGRFVTFTCSEPLLPGVEPHHSHAYRYDMVSSILTLIDLNQNAQPTSTDINEVMTSGAGTRIIYQDYSNVIYIWDAISGFAQQLGSGQDIRISTDGNTVITQEVGGTSRAGVWPLQDLAVDNLSPIVNGSTSNPPNSAGWYKVAQQITWSSTDQPPSTNIPNIPPATMLNIEGQQTYTSGLSCDLSGNCSTGSFIAKLDSILPSGSYSGSSTVVKILGQTIAGVASDITSGVAKVEIIDGTTTLSSQAGDISLSCDSENHNCSWVANPSKLSSGIKTLTLKTTDLADNVYITTKQYVIL